MAKKTTTTKTTKPKTSKIQKIKIFFGNRQTQTILGVFIAFFAIFLLISFVSYLFNWQEDQSQLSAFANKNTSVNNLLGKIGAALSELIIYKGFGLASIYIPILLFFSGVTLF